MTSPACLRCWEAGALQDGRLSGPDRLSFERHCMTCIACRHESAVLLLLRDEVRKSAPTPLTPLERQRRRAALLSLVNARAISQRAPTVRRGAAITIAALSIGIAAFAAVAHRRHPTVLVSATRELLPPRFDTFGAPDAVWTRESADATTTVTVANGHLSFTVAPLEPNQRFVVRVPDGEVDVRGTGVTVDVRDRRTRSVSALEGRVVFRRRAEPELELFAGETWSHSEPVLSVTAPAVSARTLTPAAPQPSTLNIVETSQPLRAGPLFAAALATFEAGDYEKADADLQRFELVFPSDRRSEDAAYLRAVARWRAGDRTQARALARSYLERFPKGLRGPEAEELLSNDGGTP